jgi:hypothetical protein
VAKEKNFLLEAELLPVKLDHFSSLCDSIGMKQHALHGVPLLDSGYTLDDNARALVAMLDLGELFDRDAARPYCVRFLSFLNHMQLETGWFRNLLGIDRGFLDSGGSGDCFGRAMWALGKAANSWLPFNQRTHARKMLDKSLEQVPFLEDARPIALTLIGLDEFAKAHPERNELSGEISALGKKLVSLYEENSESEWKWFEETLTYDNSRIPQALFAAFQATGNKRFLGVARESFAFLKRKTFADEMFVPVGQDGWFPRGGEKALFDQQPIEAASMVQASTQAFFVTTDDDYARTALACFNWFFGGNSLGASLYEKETGACFDGLTPKEVNLNQGAESLVEFLLARFCIERMKRQKI